MSNVSTVSVKKGQIIAKHRNGAGGFYCFELLNDAVVPTPLTDYNDDRKPNPINVPCLSLVTNVDGNKCEHGFTFDVNVSWFALDRPTFEQLWDKAKDMYELDELLYNEAQKQSLKKSVVF